MDGVGVATDSLVLAAAEEGIRVLLTVAETLVRVTLFVRELVMTVVESWAETTEAPAARTVRRMFEICILREDVGCDDLMCLTCCCYREIFAIELNE